MINGIFLWNISEGFQETSRDLREFQRFPGTFQMCHKRSQKVLRPFQGFSRVVQEVLEDFRGFAGHFRRFQKGSRALQGRFRQSQGVSWDFRVFQGVLEDTREFQGIARGVTGVLLGVSGDFMGVVSGPKRFNGFQGLLGHSVKSQVSEAFMKV